MADLIVVRDPILGEIQRAVIVRDGVVVEGPLRVDSGKAYPQPKGQELVIIDESNPASVGWTVMDDRFEAPASPIVVEDDTVRALAQAIATLTPTGKQQLLTLLTAVDSAPAAEVAEAVAAEIAPVKK